VVKKSGLGKGFGSLLPDDFDRSVLLDKKDRVQMINVDEIKPNPGQPRKHFDEDEIEGLSKSIKRYGILQPLVVTPEDDGYIIVAGERRFRAAKGAKLKTLPVLVRTSAELERLEIGLIENVQRVDLSPLEQAASIAKLHEQFNLTYDEIAKRLGKGSSTITNIVRLLNLPENAQEALKARKISEGHARAILALKGDEAGQQELLDGVIKLKWSVRQAEQYVASRKKGLDSSKTLQKKLAKTEESAPLSKYLKKPVFIRHLSRGGEIRIKFDSEDELEEISKRILG
jgi:ParB family transcriptional regulator, chromosome partitioning protein